jgi:CxxC motif-containing protein
MSLKFGILKEIDQKQDSRVPFSPGKIVQLMKEFPQLQFYIESASNRVFSDEDYQQVGVEVVSSISDCDVSIGINPIPSSELIPNKQYFFVTEVVNSDKPMFTLDTMLGLVGTYSAFRAFGLKFELFKLPSIATFTDQSALTTYLKRPVLPPLKIMVIGSEELAIGAEVIMKAMKVKKVNSEDFKVKTYAQAVFTLIDDLSAATLDSFTKVSDICIIGALHYGNSVVLSQELLNAKDCNLRVIADLKPSSSNSIASTLRQSTVDEPFYGYLPSENKEVDLYHPAAIVVAAQPDSTTEFPKVTSEFIGNQLAQYYLPTLFK